MSKVTSHEPKVGVWVKPDGWSHGVTLLDSDWDKANFYIPVDGAPLLRNGPIRKIAANIEVIGRAVTTKDEICVVRVKITWVGDESPDSYTRGYMECSLLNEVAFEDTDDGVNTLEAQYS